MKFKPNPSNDITRYIFIILLCIVAIWFCEDTGLFEGINNYCYDLAFRLRGERSHADQIIIAAIDEKTLAKLGKWPIQRSYYAELLGYFDKAAAVGIDIIFSEASEDDDRLSNAIARQGKVVLPVYVDSRFNISAPAKVLSPAGFGHVHLEQGIDGIVRQVFHAISCGSVTLPSFAAALDGAINGRTLIQSEIQPTISHQEVIGSIFQSNNMWINFYGAPGTFRYLSVADILDGNWPPAFFADKVVLVGKTAVGLYEGILTPFTNGRRTMPAVEVHAHILNNILDNSNIRPLKPWIRWTFVTLLTISCFFIFIRFGSLSSMLIGSLSLLAITVVTFFFFSSLNIWLAPASFYFSVGASFSLAYIFNLQKMKKLLLQAKENWEESFNTINDAICIHDESGRIIQANRTAEQTFGSPLLKFLEQRCQNLYARNDGPFKNNAPKNRHTAFSEETFHPELNRHLEIKALPQFGANGQLKGVVQVVRDITENKNSQKEQQMLQLQLIQAQKMEAIGTLAGGIAHDFNNILAAVMGYTELALLSLPEKSPMAVQLNHVLKASMRAKELVEQILTFSRQTKQDFNPKPVQIGLIVKEALKLIKSTFPSTIQVRMNIVSDGKVVIDPSQMHQIVMNLCTNAKFAMQENGGILTVELTDINVEPQTEILDRDPDLQPGPYIKLAVKDTGHGMAPVIAKRIFEPYFTTKEKDVGTGLGLAMVHGITKNCGGTILLETQVDKGATFYVYLPRTHSNEIPEEKGATIPHKSAPTGAERILFVDDELELIDLGQEILERLGYQVVTKRDGIEALQEFKGNPDSYDIVITDMTMPKMTGEKLARELIGIRPDIPIILCTGYSEQINEEKARAIGIKAFLMKPLTMNSLAKTVRSLLD